MMGQLVRQDTLLTKRGACPGGAKSIDREQFLPPILVPGVVPVRSCSAWGVVLVGSCPGRRGVVLVGSCPGGKLSWWGVVPVGICPGGECPSGVSRWEVVLVGNHRNGELSVWDLSSRELSNGELS